MLPATCRLLSPHSVIDHPALHCHCFRALLFATPPVPPTNPSFLRLPGRRVLISDRVRSLANSPDIGTGGSVRTIPPSAELEPFEEAPHAPLLLFRLPAGALHAFEPNPLKGDFGILSGIEFSAAELWGRTFSKPNSYSPAPDTSISMSSVLGGVQSAPDACHLPFPGPHVLKIQEQCFSNTDFPNIGMISNTLRCIQRRAFHAGWQRPAAAT